MLKLTQIHYEQNNDGVIFEGYISGKFTFLRKAAPNKYPQWMEHDSVLDWEIIPTSCVGYIRELETARRLAVWKEVAKVRESVEEHET